MALDMDSEPSTPTTTQSSYFTGCMASPAWLPPGVRRSPARFQLLARGGGDRDDDATGGRGGRRAWRGLLRRLVRESKSICTNACRAPAAAATATTTFKYDADSYAKNFDSGRWHPCAVGHALSPLPSRWPVDQINPPERATF
ncbi:unnamed protein product [Urochloa decumbens]|uniref:Uncharacterized protein n=1 Tax=Urochloa decumbens TaxID=240449 RepID=A0ABC8WGE2_9POAL